MALQCRFVRSSNGAHAERRSGSWIHIVRGGGCSAVGSVGVMLDSLMDVAVVDGRCVMADFDGIRSFRSGIMTVTARRGLKCGEGIHKWT